MLTALLLCLTAVCYSNATKNDDDDRFLFSCGRNLCGVHRYVFHLYMLSSEDI